MMKTQNESVNQEDEKWLNEEELFEEAILRLFNFINQMEL